MIESISNNKILLGVAILFLLIIFYLLYRVKSAEKERDTSTFKYQELKEEIDKIKLENLESKLNPHLFKNILNSIQSHAYQAYFALDKLANVLDYILYESRRKYVTPKEEIEFALNLIEINKIKVSPLFDLKVKTKINDNEALYTQKVLAPLVCIDLIENAFKHADLRNEESFISITFELKDNILLLTVANKISKQNPIQKENSGLGVKNLEQRLKLIYGDNYNLQFFVEEDVYIAHLKIKLLEHKIKMLAARR